MIQIIILAHGITIGTINYPNNSLCFKQKDENIEIRNLSGGILYFAPFTDFMNSSNTPYAKAQYVINDLLLSYT